MAIIVPNNLIKFKKTLSDTYVKHNLCHSLKDL